MDINFLAGIATIISTIIGLITLYSLLKDKKQTPNQSEQQGRGSIYIPEYIKRQQLTKGKRRTLFVLASISFIICIVSIGILFGLGRFLPKISTDTPTVTSTIAPNPTVTLSLPKWRPLLKQLAPDCNNSKGVAWYVHVNGTFEKCSGSSLLMQRISPQYYADMELIEINHMTYNQTTFHVQVQVTFQNPGDTGTLAGL